MSEKPRTFGSDFKQFFLRGLVVLLPTVLTLWIVVKAYQFVDKSIAQPINTSARVVIARATPFWGVLREEFEPNDEQVAAEVLARGVNGSAGRETQIRNELRRANIDQWWGDHWFMNFIGIVTAIVAVYIAGRLLGGFFGRRMYRKLENVITTLPIFKQVYPYVKQVVDFLFSDDQPIKFNRVVLVQYPREGIWSVGFLTGHTMRSIAHRAGASVTVFIPSSPTPFTGYTITVPRDEVLELSISVEEAIRFAVTGGVLIPDHQELREAMSPLEPAEPISNDPTLRPISPPSSPGDEPQTEGDKDAPGSSRRNVG
ncbi:MAG: DUF502 domain-containing protein [Planctomycetota bacterium]|jgi:uncharacterized membrane protein